MRNRLLSILLILMIVLYGCRSRKEAHGVSRRDLLTETNIEARRLDSVSLSENYYKTFVIEFFPPSDSVSSMDATQEEKDFHTLGAVRRVTIETGRNASVVLTVSDTMSVHQREVVSETTEKTVEKETEKGQNLPLILAIAAFAAAMMIYFDYSRNK